jgi:hypothetical protein
MKTTELTVHNAMSALWIGENPPTALLNKADNKQTKTPPPTSLFKSSVAHAKSGVKVTPERKIAKTKNLGQPYTCTMRWEAAKMCGLPYKRVV